MQKTNNNEWAERGFDRLVVMARGIYMVLREIVLGLIQGRLPIMRCAVVAALMCLAFNYGLDYWVFKKLGFTAIYPYRLSPKLYQIYKWFWVMSGVWGWAVYQIIFKRRKQARLDEIFITSGLRNAAGKMPRFISEWRVDAQSSAMRLSNAGLPKEKFEQQRSYLESALGIYIDDFVEDRGRNQIDILYSHEPMPDHIEYKDYQMSQQKGASFFVGTNRSERFGCSLRDTPHLLVAGETSSGKSTFLRQVITTLYCASDTTEFTLIDLKNGLEFQLFKELPRVAVVPDLDQASVKLRAIESELQQRLELFAKEGAKDIDSYLERTGKQKSFGRHIIVIDEAAELFLGAGHLKNAQAIVSKIARQGRAAGLHLLIGTQRPDSRALDSQIKANLPGKVCFQMADHSSSMTVLGNGKAKSLPAIPGRAIWQKGMTNSEVQTPFLSPADADALLKKYRTTKSKPETLGQNASTQVEAGW